MRAYEVGTQKGLDSLRLSDRPDPAAGPTEAVVKVGATALNHRDLMIMNARYMGAKPEDRIPVSDGAGEVISVGPEVTNVAPGDRVIVRGAERLAPGQAVEVIETVSTR